MDPDIRQTEPDIRQTEPDIRQTEPDVRQMEPDIRQTEADFRPDTGHQKGRISGATLYKKHVVQVGFSGPASSLFNTLGVNPGVKEDS